MAKINITPQIDKDVTMKLFKNFAGMEDVKEDTEENIMKCCDLFWEFSTQTWESYAHHAGRQHLEKSDIQLHMLRANYVQDYNDFSASVAQHLPLDLMVEVIEIAQTKSLSPKSIKRQTSILHSKTKVLNNSIYSAGQIYARRKLFSPSFKKSKITTKAKKHSSRPKSVNEASEICTDD